jgi:pimeloyl-ACP methyl ester carboxylesterase
MTGKIFEQFSNCRGAIVAWEFAMKFPESVGKLVVMNGPTMAASEKTASLDQLVRSWYVMVFQLPSPLPEHRFLKYALSL